MQLQFNNTDLFIRTDNSGLVNITDVWKGVGSPDKKSPTDWLSRESAIELIDTLTAILNTPKMGVLKSNRGRYGGTWAHKNLALSYAKWLNPALHLAVNQAFIERLEEEKNPELAVERGNARAERSWTKQGKSPEWIERRIMSITARKSFARVLASHGVHHNGFRNCTNAIYTPMYGGSSEVVRTKKQLKPTENIRDNMSLVELGAILLTESLAAEAIEQQQASGNGECELICGKTAKVIAQSVLAARKGQNSPTP
ncbi:KilA-N domain-containing protein [Fibrella sp. ES10-3-2-2]|nr:hypothetical protein A6C57_00005 [Fibrella sp. ES10-3-2-2]